jgi:hypothetical protein
MVFIFVVSFTINLINSVLYLDTYQQSCTDFMISKIFS